LFNEHNGKVFIKSYINRELFSLFIKLETNFSNFINFTYYDKNAAI